MTHRLYMKPDGLLAGRAAVEAVAQNEAAWIAGGPVAFALASIVEGSPGASTSRILPFADFSGSSETALQRALERICSVRPALAGVALDRPRVMGVVNVTPDSFSDGGLYDTTEAAVTHAARLIDQGADFIDVGGESTRPGASPVEAERESKRILPVIEGLRGAKAVISADTRKSTVMARAAAAGAGLLNDVSALTHEQDSLAAAAESGLPVVLMHAQGDPRTMQDNPTYADVVLEVYDFLEARIDACIEAGIPRERLIADPGIGFGKTIEHNLSLMASLAIFHGLGVPLLVGASRKSFIGRLTDEADPSERLAGSLAAVLAATAQGVQIHRVHDVGDTVKALRVWQAATGIDLACPV